MQSGRLTHLPRHVLDQSPSVPPLPTPRLGANVDQIPRVMVVFLEGLVLDIVQGGKEVIEEAYPSFLAHVSTKKMQSIHAAPQHWPKAIHVHAGRHP